MHQNNACQEKHSQKFFNFYKQTHTTTPEAKQSKWAAGNLFMGLTFSTQLHVKWRKMMPSHNHEYEFGIISFEVSFFTNNFQSDSHLWLHQAWFIKTTVKVFLLFGQTIRICRLRNAKGKFNISVRLFECERTGNDPYLRKYAVLFLTRNLILALPAFVEKCYASSKIIYPKWKLWICFLVSFPSPWTFPLY